MKSGLYHKNFGFPAGAAAPFLGENVLELSSHAWAQCGFDDGHISIPAGQAIYVEPADIVEIGIRDGKPVKAVVRLEYSETQHICFAILPPVRGRVFVKSVWLNDAKDNHKTLNARLYARV